MPVVHSIRTAVPLQSSHVPAPVTAASAGFVATDPHTALQQLLAGAPQTTRDTFALIDEEECGMIAEVFGRAGQPGASPSPEILSAYLKVRIRNWQMVDRATVGQPGALRQLVQLLVIQKSIAHLIATPTEPIKRDAVARWIIEAKQSAGQQVAQDREAALMRDGFPQSVAHAIADWLKIQMGTNRWSSAQADTWLARHRRPLQSLQGRLGNANFRPLWDCAPRLPFPERVALLTIVSQLHADMPAADLQALLERYMPGEPNADLVAQVWDPVIRRVWEFACGEWEQPPDPACLPPLFDAALAQRPFAAFTQEDAAAVANQALAAWRSARFVQWVGTSNDTMAEETEGAPSSENPDQTEAHHALAKDYRGGGEKRAQVLALLQQEFPQFAATDIARIAERLSDYLLAMVPAKFIPIVRDRLQRIADAVDGVQSHIDTLSRRLKGNQRTAFRNRLYNHLVNLFCADPKHVAVSLRRRHYHLVWLYQVYIPYMDNLDQEAVANAPPEAAGIETRYGEGTYAGVAAFFHEKYPTLHPTAVSRHITDCYAGIERTLQKEGLTTFVNAVDRRIQGALNATKKSRSPKARVVEQWQLPEIPTAVTPPARQATPVVATQLPSDPAITRFLADVASGWFDGPQHAIGNSPVERGTIAQIDPSGDGAHLVAIVTRGRNAIHLLCQRGVSPEVLTGIARQLDDALQHHFPNLESGWKGREFVLETGAAVRNHIRTVVWEELAKRMRRSQLPDTNEIAAILAAEVGYMQQLLAIADAQIRKANPKLLALAKKQADRARPLADLPVAKSKRPPFVIQWRMGRPHGWIAGFYDPSFRGTMSTDDVTRYCRAEIEAIAALHYLPEGKRVGSVFPAVRPTIVFGEDLTQVRATLRRCMPLFGRE